MVGQGLRTLELCIENLTPSFLDPILFPVINELMQALWKVFFFFFLFWKKINLLDLFILFTTSY